MKKIFLTIVLVFLYLPLCIEAQDVLGQQTTFNIESSYDLSERTEMTATLIKLSPTVYWYIDNNWWSGLSPEEQEQVRQSLDSLIEEFETHIYSKLTRTFGFEWTPGIDKDTRMTVLIFPMKKEAGGYFDSSDEYSKTQIPESNQREMVYLNAQYVNTINAKVFLAHEFTHLITFNQKDKIHNVSEDVWLNEARAEYSATLLGYNKDYKGSNLQRRVKDFLNGSSDSLTEWRETPSDYGVINLFIQYLVDHYGIEILIDSLKMRKTGIESLNAVLFQQGFKEDFTQIFTDWTVAVLINNCQVSEKYCYYDQNLKNFRVTPLINYLPFVGESILSVTNTTKDWSGNWHKFVGGKGQLLLEFKGSNEAKFKVPYIIQDSEGNLNVDNLVLDENQDGEILVSDFGSQNISLTIIPSAQNKISGFSDLQPSYSFFWSASTFQEEKEETIPSLTPLQKPISEMTREEVLARIAEIKILIVKLQELLIELRGSEISCQRITQDLYFGMEGNLQVRCLQEFLKAQGSEIYPEGLVTGNFYTLTEKAVIRFQEKYSGEILAPWGLTKGSGYAGETTRTKINELLGG